MKTFIFGGLVLLLAAASPATAADHHKPGGGSPHKSASRPAMHMSHPHAVMRVHAPRPVAHSRAYRLTAAHRRFRASAHGHMMRHSVRHFAGHTAWRNAHHPAAANHRFAKVRRAVRAHHRFHAGAYRRPHGWYSHRWRLGQRLPRGWFARDYWLSDWALYGLWAPIDGLIWVRVGPDAMLVDSDTGEIVSVDYGIFW